jgi:hypothetical protein
MTYIENFIEGRAMPNVHSIYDDPAAAMYVGELTDVELAMAYEDMVMGLDTWPSYLIIDEAQYRGLSFIDLENLLEHHYS